MIIVFDGVCNLCNAWVRFVIRHDRAADVRFASIQSPAGHALLSRHGYPVLGLDTLLVIEDDVLYVKTEAIRIVLRHLGGGWRWLAAPFLALPLPVRDFLYTRVALNRYALFGRRSACPIPSESLARRFLDRAEDV